MTISLSSQRKIAPNLHSEPGGFTLIEMAVVLFILTLLASAALSLGTTVRNSMKQKLALQNSETIKVALQNFLSRNGRLPCPALAGDTPGTATFGLETPTPGTCTGSADLGAPVVAKLGVVPWRTLGLSFDSAVDGWDNQFTYAVTLAATNLTPQTMVGMRGVLTVHSDAPTAQGLPPTGNQLNACNATAGDNSCNNFAVVVIISHGQSQTGGRNRSGASLPAPTSNRELANTNADVAFVSREVSEMVGAEFDDLVLPLTPTDLLAPLYGQGIKDEQASLQEKYRLILASLATTAIAGAGVTKVYAFPLEAAGTMNPYLTADAGKFPALECDLAPVDTYGLLPAPLQTIKDPWGNNFGYRRADAAMEGAELCPNPLLLISAGPDGVFDTADDRRYYVTKPELDAIFILSGY
jgi:prepilin-type N-terminal cleavage/methylation domain-containing protein